ncbi:adenosylcobalamin-dependent ribonucleoside-diphosphate reductase [Marinoscillum sp. MHG1-6]|uniref:adenosylcobalamin-dependent ribonucleoside-diphosphate reductase n=1 Tax=Marinoscillum sp. MHG1-6 TaxID=2959627 RepID=UPI00215849D3|nr:adenosylcobalamin-dependent ribonucleoside-diphosphate reductase [Marinoscillum sp. MHG1-6]
MTDSLPVSSKAPAKTYTYDEILKKCLQYFSGDELAATTWINKYCLKNNSGQFVELSPDDMHLRMSIEFARVEKSYNLDPEEKKSLSEYGQKRKPLTQKVIHGLFKNFKYVIPQGSVMSILGNPYVVGSLSNCVVVKAPLDSYGGIMYTDQQLAQLCKRRCGVGFDLSKIRPSGVSVKNAAGSSSGVVSFMERFSNTTREVSQNGRRGALMLTIEVTHPDIEEFITVKQDLTRVTGANISVRVTDEFMKAVDQDKEFALRWPVDATLPQVQKTVSAVDLWNKIIKCAHNTAEPGIIFWDHQHWYSTSSVYPEFTNESTNPCSEIAMQGGDSCRLMAINLFSFVDRPFTSESVFNYEKFYEVTYEAQRLMDDLVDLELESVEGIIHKIEQDEEPDYIKQVELDTWKMLYENGKKGRRTGLGFTALADAMAALGLKFDEPAAVEAIEKIMQMKCRAEFDSSIDMAIERGRFEAFDPKVEANSKFVEYFKEVFPESYGRMITYGRRNISISTVAPTGTVSMLTQTSSGIEPVFMLSYKRRRKLADSSKVNEEIHFKDDTGDWWEEFDVYHNKLKMWMEQHPNKPLKANPYEGATAGEIDWKQRIEIQSVIQKYVTHSISSTINLPEDTPISTINKIYLQAWKSGLKGITVYRDGSRSGVLVSKDDKKKERFVETKAPKRPDELKTKVIRFQNEYEHWLAFVGLLDDKPYEIFTGRAEDAFALPTWVDEGWVIKNHDAQGKSRYDFRYVDRQGYNVTIEGLSRSFNQQYWNYAKLLSGILRHGMPIADVVNLIDNLNLDKDYINTWKNGVRRALKTFIPQGTVAEGHTCPECGDSEGLIFEEGCLKCKSCGYSKCS